MDLSDVNLRTGSLAEQRGNSPRRTADLASQNTDNRPRNRPLKFLSLRQTCRGKVSRFLKKREARGERSPWKRRLGRERDAQRPKEKQPPRTLDSPDSDEEEMKELLGSLIESSRKKKHPPQSGFHSVSEKEQTKTSLGKVSCIYPFLLFICLSAASVSIVARDLSGAGSVPAHGSGAWAQ